jgi:hypothetical protein
MASRVVGRDNNGELVFGVWFIPRDAPDLPLVVDG